MYNISMTEDLKNIISLIQKSKKKIILIDGYCDTHKSTLAFDISKSLQIPHIELDNLCKRNSTAEYIANIDYPAFIEATKNLSSYIIEGILLLQFIEKINLPLADCFYIYAKKVTQNGNSVYHPYFFDIANSPQILKEQKKLQAALIEINQQMEKLPAISQEHNQLFNKKFHILLEKYHYDYLPHQKADFIYKKVKQ